MHQIGSPCVFFVSGRCVLTRILSIQSQHCRVPCGRNIGQPSDVFSVGRRIVLNEPRICRAVTCNGVDNYALIPRAQRHTFMVAIGVSRYSSSRVQSNYHATIIVSNGIFSQSVHVNGYVGNRVPTLVRHCDQEGKSRHSIFSPKIEMSLYGHGYRFEAEAVGKGAGRHGSETTGGDAVIKRCARRQALGHAEGQPCKRAVCRDAGAIPCNIQRQFTGTGAICVSAGKTVGKSHFGCAEGDAESGG